MNTPNLGQRVYIDPAWEATEAERPEKGYQCYVFTFDDSRPPGVVRLGKKGASIRIRWDEVPQPIAIYREAEQSPTHPINPLDINGHLVSYEPVMIPPHLLFRTATLAEDWWLFFNIGRARHTIHLPKRVLNRIGGVS